MYVWRIMLRFGIVVSVVPLLLTGGIVRDWFPSDFQPCITGDAADIQVTRNPWAATRSVAFTEDPKAATVRVQIVDAPELADLAIADDGANGIASGCALSDATRRIRITHEPLPGEPLIYMSREKGDYRVYLESKRMSLHEAAALIVGAKGSHERLTAAALRPLPADTPGD